jgi:hypothetical protein
MPEFPSNAPTPEVAAMFPTKLPDPEQLVYDYVAAATADGLASGVPALSFYADRGRSAAEGRKVSVVRGWPAYPGVLPAIGVAAGPETEDQQHESEQGGLAGTVYATVPSTGQLAWADYYAEPIYATVIVELIHENREERDRLHDELRRLLFPLRSTLLSQDPQLKRVRVDAEKTEETAGPPSDEAPLVVYISIFTVHVYYEMLEARKVGVDTVERVDPTPGTLPPPPADGSPWIVDGVEVVTVPPEGPRLP